MKTLEEYRSDLLDAMEKERSAAGRTAEALYRVREAAEKIDPAGQRDGLSCAKAAFDELTRQASYRNYVASRFAEAVGLKREATVATLVSALGQAGQSLRGKYSELAAELAMVRENFAVLGLMNRYGNAMTASLLEIRGSAICAVPYGKNGQRTASVARAGRLA